MSEEKKNNHTGDGLGNVIFAFGIFALFQTMVSQCSKKEDALKKYNNILPTNAHTQYVNKDTLPDLVYKTGEIFLQTKKGNFVSIDSVMNQEKTRIDSTYKAKQDSIKLIYQK